MHQFVLFARRCRAALLTLAVVTTGCGAGDPPTSPTPASATEVFAGSLAINQARFYSFTVGASGVVTVALTKVQKGGVDSGELLNIGIGQPRGTDCSVSSQVLVGADLNATVLSAAEVPSTYCVRVWDAGNISGTSTFSVNIVHPTQ